MPDMTPIRIRGKRSATPGEKWHAGKKRKLLRDASPASSGQSTAGSSPSRLVRAKPRKRKPYDPSLSRLEQLPTEILQEIFGYEPNPNLPAASRTLLSQLSSQHVYSSVTSHILKRILGFKKTRASDADLAAATRLLNSKFMTWDCFSRWLQEQYDALMPVHSIPAQGPADFHLRMWQALEPSKGLLPPKKLLIGPWPAEKATFLHLFAWSMDDLVACDPVSAEIAYVGLSQAIAERAQTVVTTLLVMNLRSTTELLRQAVIDCGCDRDIVSVLIHNCMTHYNTDWREAEAATGGVVRPGAIRADIDFFDSSLWAWADKARAHGDEKGEWLMDLLRRRARAVGGQAAVMMSPK